jgi:hypothetical protein
VVFDQSSASAALDAVARCRRTCEDARRFRRELAAWAGVGWQGRMRDLVDAELAELDAELAHGIAALVELGDAIAACSEQALELQSELERTAMLATTRESSGR